MFCFLNWTKKTSLKSEIHGGENKAVKSICHSLVALVLSKWLYSLCDVREECVARHAKSRYRYLSSAGRYFFSVVRVVNPGEDASLGEYDKRIQYTS